MRVAETVRRWHGGIAELGGRHHPGGGRKFAGYESQSAHLPYGLGASSSGGL